MASDAGCWAESCARTASGVRGGSVEDYKIIKIDTGQPQHDPRLTKAAFPVKDATAPSGAVDPCGAAPSPARQAGRGRGDTPDHTE